MPSLTITIKDTPTETQAIAVALRRFLLRTYPASLIYDNNANGQDEARRIEVTNDKQK